MQLTVEKVLILKASNIFSEIPEEALIELADVVEVIDVRPGERVITKDEVGTSMYIIIDGTVQVHDGDVEFAILGQNDVFGELAVLDPEPRIASVTAIENCRFFSDR